jgi:hypothetical protein
MKYLVKQTPERGSLEHHSCLSFQTRITRKLSLTSEEGKVFEGKRWFLK